MTNYGIRAIGVLLVILMGSVRCGPIRGQQAHFDPTFEKYISSDALAITEFQLGKLSQTLFFKRNQTQLRTALPIADADRTLLVWNGRELLIAQKTASSERVRLTGAPALVQRAGALAKAGTGKLPDELAEPLAFLPPADQIRMLVLGLPVEGLNLPSEYASLLANFRGHIRRSAIGVEAQTGLRLRARIDCFSEQGSQRVDVALRAARGLGKLSAMQKSPLEARLYDALEIRREGTSVFVDAYLPPDLSDYLVRRALPGAHH